MIKVTLEFNTQAELLAFFASSAGAAPTTKVESPKSQKPTAASETTKAAAPTATETAKVADPKPAAEPSAPAAAAVSTASSSEAGLSPEELTKAIVAAVARTSREAVLGLLQADFNVQAGKQITDPAIRAKAKAALEALA